MMHPFILAGLTLTLLLPLKTTWADNTTSLAQYGAYNISSASQQASTQSDIEITQTGNDKGGAYNTASASQRSSNNSSIRIYTEGEHNFATTNQQHVDSTQAEIQQNVQAEANLARIEQADLLNSGANILQRGSGENTAIIQQSGSHTTAALAVQDHSYLSEAIISQSASSASTAAIHQIDISDSRASIVQTLSPHSEALIFQQGAPLSRANIEQINANVSHAKIEQKNSHSSPDQASIQQQEGNDLQAEIWQNGSGNDARTEQNQHINQATILQQSPAASAAGHSALILQFSGGNIGKIIQYGTNNNASIHQF